MTRSLTDDSRRIVAEIAQRHGFQPDAGRAMAEALMASGGGMAQFNHPDLGGMGQWSKGGMSMIGDMFNDSLKARVSSLADELSEALRSGKIDGSADTSGDDAKSSRGASQAPSSDWWPKDLGSPSSTGSQNQSRYAVFPDKKRLAVEEGGRVTVYQTGDERIEGASQQQGGGSSLRFSTRSGSVRVEDLKAVDEGDAHDDVGAEWSAGPASPFGTR